MNSKTQFRITLGAKILFIVLLIVFISNVSLTFLAFKTSTKNTTNGVTNQLSSQVASIASSISTMNQNELSRLKVLANLAFMKDENVPFEEKQNQLNSVLKSLGPRYENIAFYNEKGDALVANGEIVNFTSREYFSVAFSGKDYISDPKFSPVTNSVLQHIGVPVFNNENKPIGALVLVIKGNPLMGMVSNIDLGQDYHPTIVNLKTKEVIACANKMEQDNPDAILSPSRGDFIVDFLQGNKNVKEVYDPLFNIRAITTYQAIPGTDWGIIEIAPFELYFGSLKTIRNNTLLMTFITTLIALVIIIIATEIFIKPLKKVRTSVNEIANGNADLTQRISSSVNDEVGDVVKGFNAFIEKLQNILINVTSSKDNLLKIDENLQASTEDATDSIKQIITNIEDVNNSIITQSNSVSETASAMNEISANIESLERMIENQSEGVSQASSAVEQMIGNISSVNNSVNKMFNAFGQLKEKTTYGIEAQSTTYQQISTIKEQSNMLQDANTAIAEIASQTNLLAMNAAIEAAHAGEAGKGFSVVADEIRKLSETSSDQSKTISQELIKIQNTIKQVVETSNITNAAFTSVSNSITETNEIVEHIKNAMEEQQTGSQQIIEALHNMNDSTSEVRIASTEMTTGSKQIISEIEKLQNATDMIRVSVNEMHSGASRIKETGETLTDISKQVSSSITEIGNEIGLFKI